MLQHLGYHRQRRSAADHQRRRTVSQVVNPTGRNPASMAKDLNALITDVGSYGAPFSWA